MTDDTVNVEINGVALKARKGAMLIEVADQAGIRIPRFCYHRKLSVAANCRMCLVEVERAPKPLPACATPVMEGMKVFTESELAVDAQRSVMEFLLINHPLDCPICDQGGECELQDVAMGYGRGVSRFQERKRVVPDKNLGPLIASDMTRCIHCTRCVRFGVEIGGMSEMGSTGRGEHMRIGTFVEKSVDSELSGNLIDVCPVGALTSKPFRFRARAWEMMQRPSVAPHDGVGSNINAHIKGSRVMRVVPRDNDDVNEAWLSDRDRFSYDGLQSEDRLLTPRVKRDGQWEDVEWDVALEETAKRLKAVDPSRLGALASPSSTVEEHFLLQKLVRGLGSNNVDHRLRQTDTSDQDALPTYPYLGQSIEALESLDAALVVGSNVRKEQPLINHRLRKAALAGATIMSVNPVRYPQNFKSGPDVVVSPSAMAQALAAIAAALIERGASADASFGHLLANASGDDQCAALAQTLHDAERPTVLLGHGALAHPQAATLRALGGYIAKLAGGTLGYLADGANGAGAALAGSLPHRGPGGDAVSAPGMSAHEMLQTQLDGYVLMNIEPELDCIAAALATRALDNANVVISLTSYVTPLMEQYADVLLPIAGFAETPGTYINAEGRRQGFEDVVHPPGDGRPAWRVLRVLGNFLELDGFEYRETSAIMNDVESLISSSVPENLGAWAVPNTLPEAPDGILWRNADVPAYSVDALVRRAVALQQTVDAGVAQMRLHSTTAAQLGVGDGGYVTVDQGEGQVTLPALIDDAVAVGCVDLPGGLIETSTLGVGSGPASVSAAIVAESA
jgi:NADH-quinone oxidoreductase subunit G